LGAVRLNLASAAEVAAAGRDILSKAGSIEGARLLVQEFLPGGHEVIVGAKRDPHFGPTIIFGLGGVFTEVLGDVAIGLAPLTPAEARRLVEKTKGHAVLRGARGQDPADIEALVDLIVRLSWLVSDHPGIAELDLNPVKVFAAGKGCAAVDARVLAG
jgi:acyl-CoA synthetase (NDP forming)